MNTLLKPAIANFKRELKATLSIIARQTVPNELTPFRDWLRGFYEYLEQEAERLNYYVGLNDPDLDRDIYNKLAWLLNRFQIFSKQYLPGIYRTHENDQLALKVLRWLHGQHSQTKTCPFLIMDGDFAILPEVGMPICYYLPIVSQQSLLFLPLFFHELGHYLYQCHKEEMDALVKELQDRLRSHLTVPYQTNNAQYENDLAKTKAIIETWYEWTEEFFCDAVGLHIGGATFLKAFSHHLRMGGRSGYFLPESYLANSGHPVTWLRIRFLAERARKIGLNEEADKMEQEWAEIADALNIREDYFGYYTAVYHQDILQTLDDMLTEAAPISFTNYIDDQTNFISLIHEAWTQFERQPADYDSWEATALSDVYGTALTDS
jgi:hypothetical protein